MLLRTSNGFKADHHGALQVDRYESQAFAGWPMPTESSNRYPWLQAGLKPRERSQRFMKIAPNAPSLSNWVAYGSRPVARSRPELPSASALPDWPPWWLIKCVSMGHIVDDTFGARWRFSVIALGQHGLVHQQTAQIAAARDLTLVVRFSTPAPDLHI
jgi:hypothetical protein